MSESQVAEDAGSRWYLPILLILLTFASTFYVGAGMELGRPPETLADFLSGWTFSIPLMAILLAHEFGHYLVGRYHRVDISPPFFIPMPFFLLGTMGAVIRMNGAIRSRVALFDVGASGPIAGLVVALPILIYGLWASPVEALPEDTTGYLIEGRSILYLSLLYLLKGPIPAGYDIFLTPTALAGWAGLLVTMINLVPVGQLDGGHVAYALFGERQNRYSERFRRGLPLVALIVGLGYGIPAYLNGIRGESLAYEFSAGIHWLVWAALLWWMTRSAGAEHPPTSSEELTGGRRKLAWSLAVIFVLLFMPAWIRIQ